MKTIEELGLPHRLHDTVLLNAVLNWEAGEVKLGVGAWLIQGHRKVNAVIRATGLTLFHLPREHPWGRSFYINHVRGPVSLSNERLRMEIEMQSGDVIVVEAGEFQLEVEDQDS